MKTYRYLVLLLLAISCLLSACSDQALNDAVEQPQNTATDIRDDNTDQPPANTDNIEAGVTPQTIPDNINGNTPSLQRSSRYPPTMSQLQMMEMG